MGKKRMLLGFVVLGLILFTFAVLVTLHRYVEHCLEMREQQQGHHLHNHQERLTLMEDGLKMARALVDEDLRDDVPILFAGVDPYRSEEEMLLDRFSIETMELCRAVKGGPKEETGLENCRKADCSDCLSKRFIKQVQPLIEGFKDPGFSEKREQQYARMLPDSKLVNVLSVDKHTIHMTLNWACAAVRHDPQILNKTLLLVSGEEPSQVLRMAGFNVLDLTWLFDKDQYSANWFSFKRSGFRWAMSVLILIGADLVRLGYDVILQDCDLVWRKDLIGEIELNPMLFNIDIMTQASVRFDAQGPANTGLVFVRSNAKTKHFMHAMINHLPLLYLMQDDQRLWNHMLRHYYFTQLNFRTLPHNVILGLNSQKWTEQRIQSFDPIAVHRVGSQDLYSVQKGLDLQRLGLWYFNEACTISKPSHYRDDQPFLNRTKQLYQRVAKRE